MSSCLNGIVTCPVSVTTPFFHVASTLSNTVKCVYRVTAFEMSLNTCRSFLFAGVREGRHVATQQANPAMNVSISLRHRALHSIRESHSTGQAKCQTAGARIIRNGVQSRCTA